MLSAVPGALVDPYPTVAPGIAALAFRDLLEFHGLSYFGEPLSEGFAFGLSDPRLWVDYALPQVEEIVRLEGEGVVAMEGWLKRAL